MSELVPFVLTLISQKRESNVVSALTARANFGKLLTRVGEEHQSLIIEKRGTPRAILLSIHDYVRLAALEPRSCASSEKKQNGTAPPNSPLG